MNNSNENPNPAFAQAAGSAWVPFDQSLWADQPLPTERRYVLVMIPPRQREGLPPTVAVGYLRYAAGDKNSPNFITPGVGGVPTHWNDCLGDDFAAPLWMSKQTPNAKVSGRGEETK